MRPWFLSSFLLLAPLVCAQTVEGTVVNADTGGPISGARVRLDAGPNSSSDPLYTRTGPDGHFQFAKPSQAGYTIWVDAPGYIGPGRCANALCPLTAYAVITGEVTDPYGVPIPDAQVEILQRLPAGSVHGPSVRMQPLPGGQFEVASQTQLHADDRGRFRAAPLAPGTYYVAANRPMGMGSVGEWERTYRATYYPGVSDIAGASPLELAAGGHAQANIRIVRQSGVRVTGHLSQLPSTESAATQVRLVPQERYVSHPSLPITTTTNDRFEILNVPPGKYILGALAQTPGNPPQGGKPVLGAMQDIEVGDRDLAGVEVALQPLPDLAGTVTFAEGCTPVPIRMRPISLALTFMAADEITPAANGAFLLKRLTPGRYTFNAQSLVDFRRLPVTSVRLGGSEVPKEGLDVPFTAGGTLHVILGCAAAGGPQ
jgi:hypothetical protein